MDNLQDRTITESWITASWDNYVRILDDPLHEKAKGYYYRSPT